MSEIILADRKTLINRKKIKVWKWGKTLMEAYCLNRFEQAHEIMVLFVPRTLMLQTLMCSHPVGLDVWFLVGLFVYFHTSCARTVKALARLCGCAGSPEPSLVAYAISTIISWDGSSGYLQQQLLCWRAILLRYDRTFLPLIVKMIIELFNELLMLMLTCILLWFNRDWQWCDKLRNRKRTRHEMSHVTRKPVFGVLRPVKTQTGLLSYTD